MKSFAYFGLAMRQRESSDEYHIENLLGYLGAYQFGMARLCDYGITERRAGASPFSQKNADFEFVGDMSKEKFLCDRALQDRIFRWHVIQARRQITRHFPLLPEMIDLSGAVAVCHLVGFGGLKQLLTANSDPIDANGTHASDYAKLFAGYEIP